MNDQTPRSVSLILGAVLIGGLVSLAGSQGGYRLGAVPVFAICGALAYAVNWLAYIPSNRAQTEKYFDLTGSVTYVSMTIVALALSSDLDARSYIAGVMVLVWAVRLGSFLYRRISRAGKDGRFDRIRTAPLRFLSAWTLQGLWILLTGAAAIAIITTTQREPLGVVAYVGIAVWMVGFVIEVVADQQKAEFKRDSANDGRFITTGLWAWSRHPNYFGEITLWTGVAIMAIPVLSGWQFVVLISPVFVAVLLTRISGIPMLESRADERWGDEDGYQRYKNTTPALIPRPPTPDPGN